MALAAPLNRLLSFLSPDDYRRMAPHLEPLYLDLKTELHPPHETIHSVYFPLSCVCSILSPLEGDPSIEIATVGNEGVVGASVVLGVFSVPNLTIIQIPGNALRMDAAFLLETIHQGGPLASLFFRYVQALMNQIGQSATCNRAHPIEERCARWLLMTHDRVGKDTFPLTQEFLSYMLGVRRQTVTVAAGILQQAGLIRYRRGIITVLDREALEEVSCECYQIIQEDYQSLIG